MTGLGRCDRSEEHPGRAGRDALHNDRMGNAPETRGHRGPALRAGEWVVNLRAQWLKELDWVAGGVFDQYLLAAGAADDVITKGRSGPAEAFDG